MHPQPDDYSVIADKSLDARRWTLDVSSPQWFAIQTKPRAEEKTLGFLSSKCIPTFMPRLLVHRRHRSRKWKALEPLFPGYLFARFCPEAQTIDRVRWTPGVREILGVEGEPIPVPEEAVLHLQRNTGERGFIVPGPSLLPGMRVRFRDGAMAHLEGIIERPASRAERVRVLLLLLNRPVSVEVDGDELEPV